MTSHHELLMRAVENTTEDGEQVVKLLYHRKKKHWWAADGSLMMEATTHEECVRQLDFALGLLTEARHYATYGATTARTLSDDEMTWALKWLKRVYHYHYVTRRNLAQAMTDWEAGQWFSSEDKKNISGDLGGCFRIFLRDTIGDAPIAYAILRHGYHTQEALTGIVKEVYRAREGATKKKTTR